METKEIEIFRLSEIIARSMREELSDDERRVLVPPIFRPPLA